MLCVNERVTAGRSIQSYDCSDLRRPGAPASARSRAPGLQCGACRRLDGPGGPAARGRRVAARARALRRRHRAAGPAARGASCAARWRTRCCASVDAAAARKLPGVHAVLTYRDLRPRLTCDRIPLALPVPAIRFHVDPGYLAERELAYVGEPVALVVAESRAVAEDAAGLVALDIEPLPAVLDPRAGLGARRAQGAARLSRQSARALDGKIRRRRRRLRRRGASRVRASAHAQGRRPFDRGARRGGALRRARKPAHGLGFDPDAAQGQARAGRGARAHRERRCA